MFSLLVTIIAIALAVAAAAIAIYYGTVAYANRLAMVNAATLTNQASQLYGAALLFYQANGCWPDSPAQLTGKSPTPVACTGTVNTTQYLASVPVPPQSAVTPDPWYYSLVSSAHAAAAPGTWTFLKEADGRLSYLTIKQSVNNGTCQMVQRQVKGARPSYLATDQETIPGAIDPGYIYQCVADLLTASASNPKFSYFWRISGADPCTSLPAFNAANAADGVTTNLACGAGAAAPADSLPAAPAGKDGFWVIDVSNVYTADGSFIGATFRNNPSVSENGIVGFASSCPAGAVNPATSGQKIVYGANEGLDMDAVDQYSVYNGSYDNIQMQRTYCIPALSTDVLDLGAATAGATDTYASTSYAAPTTDFGSLDSVVLKSWTSLGFDYYSAALTAKGQVYSLVAGTYYFGLYDVNYYSTYQWGVTVGGKIGVAKGIPAGTWGKPTDFAWSNGTHIGGPLTAYFPFTSQVVNYTVPSIASVSPAQVDLAGGTTVTLTGTALDKPGLVVKFDGKTALNLKVLSATQATATVPAGTTTGYFNVMAQSTANPDGTTCSSCFQYQDMYVVDRIVIDGSKPLYADTPYPSQLTSGCGGALGHVYGSHLPKDLQVTFQWSPVPTTWVSDTEATFWVPECGAGSCGYYWYNYSQTEDYRPRGTFRTESATRTATGSNYEQNHAFIDYSMPTITAAYYPANLTAGSTVTLVGSDFCPNMQANFNGTTTAGTAPQKATLSYNDGTTAKFTLPDSYSSTVNTQLWRASATYPTDPREAVTTNWKTIGGAATAGPLTVTFNGTWSAFIGQGDLLLTNSVSSTCMNQVGITAQNNCMRDEIQAQLGTGAYCTLGSGLPADSVVAAHPSAVKEEFLQCSGVTAALIPGVSGLFPDGYRTSN